MASIYCTKGGAITRYSPHVGAAGRCSCSRNVLHGYIWCAGVRRVAYGGDVYL
jgi:hypothetical protein